MIIFEAESKIDGLAEKVLANQSIAYHSQLQPWTHSESQEKQTAAVAEFLKKHNLAKASVSDSDLFTTKSILVTSNWNKNDDVFSPVETWAARHTPSHKPTNLDHDEKRLVGHITDTWALDAQGNIIPDNTVIDDLPSLFHIANGAVIYTNWQDEDLVERTEKLIAEIQSGEKYVSMEAIFTNFDYAVATPEEELHVVARCQDTAFLTKHLRCYGGTGEYEGCKLGRVLKNITFSGKGYVNKPANPDSIIFTEGKVFNYAAASNKNPFSKESGVSLFCSSNSSKNEMGISSMSDTQSVDLLKSQNEELKNTIAELQDKVDELTKAHSEAGVKSLESEVDALKSKLETAQSEKDEAVAKLEKVEAEKAEAEKSLTEVTEAKEALEKEVTEAKEEKVKADRISRLVDGGVEKQVAEEKVSVFANLNDEQFEAIAEEIISAKAKKHEDMKNKEKDEKKDEEKKDKKDAKASDSSEDLESDPAESNASEEVLDNAEENNEPKLTVEASDKEDDEVASLREELRSAFASRLGRGDKADSSK